MLLGASSDATGSQADLGAVAGEGDGSVEEGRTLIEFAEAAHRGDSVSRFVGQLGEERFVEAAATVAIFNGLVRTADASGIPLDDGTVAATARARSDLGIDRYNGAQNTLREHVGPDVAMTDVRQVFE